VNFIRCNFFWLMITAIALLAGFLRFQISSAEQLWLDELHTSWTVNGTFADVSNRARLGNQQPIFFCLTKASINWLGHSELTLRLISILASIGTLVVASWLTWRWTSSTVASTIVALLMAIDSQFVFYGSEARPYALVQFLGVIQVLLFARIIWASGAKALNGRLENRDSLLPFWGLAVASVALIYTHLTSIWLMAAEALFLLLLMMWRLKKSAPRIPCFRFLSTGAVTLFAILPLFSQTSMILDRKENWESVSSLLGLLSDGWIGMTTLILIPTIYLAIANDIRRTSASESISENLPSRVFDSRLGFVFLWAIIPFLLVAMLHCFKVAPLALGRYTLVGASAFPIFAGLCIGQLASSWNRAALAICIFAGACALNPLASELVTQGTITQMRIEDWKTPITEINLNDAKSAQPVFLFANVIEDSAAFANSELSFQEYLLFPLGGIDQIENLECLIQACPTLGVPHFNEKQIELVKEQGGAWLIVRAQEDLVLEIINELESRLLENPGRKAAEPTFSVLNNSNSPVHLISVQMTQPN
jgi:hypothetical protein